MLGGAANVIALAASSFTCMRSALRASTGSWPSRPALRHFERLLPRLGEADGMGRTKPHLLRPPTFLEAEHPGFRAAGAHLQEEPAPSP